MSANEKCMQSESQFRLFWKYALLTNVVVDKVISISKVVHLFSKSFLNFASSRAISGRSIYKQRVNYYFIYKQKRNIFLIYNLNYNEEKRGIFFTAAAGGVV